MPTPTSPARSGSRTSRRSPAPPPSAARRRKPKSPPSGETVRAGVARPPPCATAPLDGAWPAITGSHHVLGRAKRLALRAAYLRHKPDVVSARSSDLLISYGMSLMWRGGQDRFGYVCHRIGLREPER